MVSRGSAGLQELAGGTQPSSARPLRRLAVSLPGQSEARRAIDARMPRSTSNMDYSGKVMGVFFCITFLLNSPPSQHRASPSIYIFSTLLTRLVVKCSSFCQQGNTLGASKVELWSR